MIERIRLWIQQNPIMILRGIGVLCLLLAVALMVNPVRLVTRGQSAEGVVSDVVKRRVHNADNKDKDEYTATIRFKAGDRNMAFQRSWSQDPYSSSFCFTGCFSKGEKLKVRYLVDNPEFARVDSFGGLFGASLIFGLVGAVFVFLGWFAKPAAEAPGSTEH
jgi:Protein of unknown function (DUF3592)